MVTLETKDDLSSGDVCYCLILVETVKWQQILVKFQTSNFIKICSASIHRHRYGEANKCKSEVYYQHFTTAKKHSHNHARKSYFSPLHSLILQFPDN
jgi:hypothetical protein